VTPAAFYVVRDPDEPARDDELERLLWRAYVDGGFTDRARAAPLFAADGVRRRGTLVLARSVGSRALLGMVIAVPPTSPARHMADPDEIEMHLLAVAPEHGRMGIGAALVEAVIGLSKREGYRRLVLWTQPSMHAAHRLYERASFQRAPPRDFVRDDRRFLVYELDL
jgi:ribosomal protein S18 acetylase RimI-like enzyme